MIRIIHVPTALVLSMVLLPSNAVAEITETYNKTLWQATVGEWTTIGFTGWPMFTSINNQYQDEGVTFTDQNDYILLGSLAFPNDGSGLNSNEGQFLGRITAQFSRDMHWVAVDHPTHIRIYLYHQGSPTYTSNVFIGSTNVRFAGIVSTKPFDKVVIESISESSVAIDDLFFGAPIPAPGALALLMFALSGNRRRSCSRR